MSIFDETVFNLFEAGQVKELYRFQGCGSRDYLDIKSNELVLSAEEKYVYFSDSFVHHKYFALKRLKQLIKSILIDTQYDLCSSVISNNNYFPEIVKLICNSPKMEGINSVKLIFDESYYKLLIDNCSFNYKKMSHFVLERVDNRRYGGGYGISDEWLKLLKNLSLFFSYAKIDSLCMEQLLHNIKVSGRISSLNNIDFIKFNKYILNPDVFNSFTKYQIIENLETIIDRQLLLPDSYLAKNPNKAIKETINNYQNTREKTLKLFEKHFIEL